MAESYQPKAGIQRTKVGQCPPRAQSTKFPVGEFVNIPQGPGLFFAS
jgi:hypothetical protein